jgi:tetratricopeptide (TPR) repeat protein
MTMARNAPDVLLYAGKVALPIDLNVTPGLTATGATLGAISLMLVGWPLARQLERPKLLFVVGWFLLLVAPALLVPGLPAYEHRLYFPLLGVMVGFSHLRIWQAPGRRRVVWIAGAVATGVAFSIVTAAHMAVFRDRYAFWTSATEGTPHAGVAHVNLGQIYESDGDVDRAADHYRRALAIDSATPGAHNNLGVVLAKRGDLGKARVSFEKEIEEHPGNADAHFNLGLWYKLAGRVDEAVPRWQQAIAVDPYYVPAYRELAAYYAAKGDAAQAGLYTDRLRAIEAHRIR